MTAISSGFFLFIGSSDSESAVSRLKTAGVPYRKKLLESSPENWDKIIQLLRDDDLRGVIATFTSRVYTLMTQEGYRDRARSLLEALGKVAHVVCVHEAVLFGETEGEAQAGPDELVPGEDDDYLDLEGDYYRQYFGTVSQEAREWVNDRCDELGVELMPYKTNAERSILSTAFIEAHEQNLLFRVYVPAGRLYSAEAEKLLDLFQDWLNQTGRAGVRTEGYKTPSGQVYEMFAAENVAGQVDLARQFTDFADFLDACSDDPEAASAELVRLGVEKNRGEQIVQRYGRELRRLQMDLRHSREERLLALSHSLESDLLETESLPTDQLRHLVDCFLPPPVSSTGLLAVSSGSALPQHKAISITVNQQFIGHVEGVVGQSVSGTVNLGPEAKTLLSLIEQFGGDSARELESAVHELEDDRARPADRLTARQRLKRFVSRVGGHLESAAVAALQKYLEAKLGVG
jgi:hypothetical protein